MNNYDGSRSDGRVINARKFTFPGRKSAPNRRVSREQRGKLPVAAGENEKSRGILKRVNDFFF